VSERRGVPVNPETARRIGSRVPLSELTHPVVCAALALWNKRRGPRAFPSRTEIVPKSIASILRNVMLIGIVEDQSDFEFRIVGDAAVVVYGLNFQGMRRDQLNALESGFGDVIQRVCDSICRSREPIGVNGVVEHTEISVHHHQGIFLPLGNSEFKVDHVLFVGGYVPMDISELIDL